MKKNVYFGDRYITIHHMQTDKKTTETAQGSQIIPSATLPSRKGHSLILYANHGQAGEIAAYFVAADGPHRMTVRKIGINQLVSISRCQITLNPDNR